MGLGSLPHPLTRYILRPLCWAFWTQGSEEEPCLGAPGDSQLRALAASYTKQGGTPSRACGDPASAPSACRVPARWAPLWAWCGRPSQ